VESFVGDSKIFEGVKVADFSWTVVGPLTIRYLAMHGATVIHVESSLAPDDARLVPPFKDDITGLNRAPFWADLNSNKYGLALNLNHPKGLEVARRLIVWADIVAESYSPGKMAKWGLRYEDVKKINSSVIYYSASSQGQTGPHSRHPGLGIFLVALAGFTHLLGYPDEPPLHPYGAYTDYICPRLSVAALVAALNYRRRTGIGQYLDLSQFEASLHFIAPVLLDYDVNKYISTHKGNRCDYFAPHNVFICKGNNNWCVISVLNDKQWNNLCHVIGDAPWTKDEKFRTFIGRKKNEDELENLISSWTSKFEPNELMKLLQEAGVPAAAVLNGLGIIEDEQLISRKHFKMLEHPEIGNFLANNGAYKLSDNPADLERPGPCLGQDTEYVCTRLLGMSDEEFVELMAEGVFE
jgi:benzylsuccinate CoA-transferase BbsF subunit